MIGIHGVASFSFPPRLQGFSAESLTTAWFGVSCHGTTYYDSKQLYCTYIGTVYEVDSALSYESPCHGIANVYQTHGLTFPLYLHGAFVVLLYDKVRDLLILAVDHMAQRSLFYRRNGERIEFSDDISQLLTNNPNTITLNYRKILEFLSPLHVIDETVYWPHDTFFNNIRKLSGGELLLLARQQPPLMHRYWEPPTGYTSRSFNNSTEALADRLKTVLRHQVADKNICVEFSGGIDSSCLLFLITNILNREIQTVTHYRSNEERTCLTALLKNLDRVNPTFLRAADSYKPLEAGRFRSSRRVEGPCSLNIPELLVSMNLVAQNLGCDVVISGEGADTYLQGSDLIWDSSVRSGHLSDMLSALRGIYNSDRLGLLLEYLTRYLVLPLMPRPISSLRYTKEFYSQTYRCEFPDIFTARTTRDLEAVVNEQRRFLLKDRRRYASWEQRLEIEMLWPPNHQWQSITLPVDVLYPYYDRHLIELGLSIHAEHKFDPSDATSYYGASKQLQRTAFEEIVPISLISSQEKRTYPEAIEERYRAYSDMLGMEEGEMLVSALQLVDPVKLRHKLEDRQNQYPLAEDDYFTSWCDAIISLEYWLRATSHEFDLSPNWFGCRG